MKAAHLYLVVFPERQVIKVGKALDVVQRLGSLKRWWGEPDYAQSYCLAASEALVYKFERGLHGLLAHHQVSCGSGDGATELFSIAALDIALAHLNLVMMHAKDEQLQLTKGIVLPAALSKARLTRSERALRRLDARTDKTLDSLASIVSKLRYLKKMLIFLVRRQDRIEYQWEIVGSSYIFRVRNAAFIRSNHSALFLSLSFHFEDLTAFRGRSYCSMVGQGDLCQFELDFPRRDGDDVDPANPLLFVSAQLQSWLHQIPSRSAALIQDLPVLDARRIRGSFFDGNEPEAA